MANHHPKSLLGQPFQDKIFTPHVLQPVCRHIYNFSHILKREDHVLGWHARAEATYGKEHTFPTRLIPRKLSSFDTFNLDLGFGSRELMFLPPGSLPTAEFPLALLFVLIR